MSVVKIKDVEIEKKEKPGAYTPKEVKGYILPPDTKKILNSVKHKRNVLLVGETGTGKTSLVYQLGAMLNEDVLYNSCQGETSKADIVGQYVVEPDPVTNRMKTVWKDGRLITAMRNGYWFILDEMDFARPDILELLHSLADENPNIVLDSKDGECVYPHPNFRLFATANSIGAMSDQRSLYQGTNIMNPALIDRFHVFHIRDLSKEDTWQMLIERIEGITGPIAEKMVQVVFALRGLKDKEEILSNFSNRRLLSWANEFMLYADPIDSAAHTIFNKLDNVEGDLFRRTIQEYMGGKL